MKFLTLEQSCIHIQTTVNRTAANTHNLISNEVEKWVYMYATFKDVTPTDFVAAEITGVQYELDGVILVNNLPIILETKYICGLKVSSFYNASINKKSKNLNNAFIVACFVSKYFESEIITHFVDTQPTYIKCGCKLKINPFSLLNYLLGNNLIDSKYYHQWVKIVEDFCL